MRRFLAVTAVVGGAILGAPRPAVAGTRNCVERLVGTGVVLVCDDAGGNGAPGVGGGGGPSEPYVTVVVTGTDAAGLPCAGTASVPLSQAYGGGLTVDEVEATTGARAVELGMLGVAACPGADPVIITPQLWARSYLRSIPLPVPEPRIDPGVMLVGLESFLETGSPITEALSEPGTPFGPASFTFTSTVTVDWGDGTVSGPVASAGGPYPDGDLRHVYIRQGTYDIVVTQDWTATWQIGAESGTVAGLQTTGTLDAFPVQEREAVIVG